MSDVRGIGTISIVPGSIYANARLRWVNEPTGTSSIVRSEQLLVVTLQPVQYLMKVSNRHLIFSEYIPNDQLAYISAVGLARTRLLA